MYSVRASAGLHTVSICGPHEMLLAEPALALAPLCGDSIKSFPWEPGQTWNGLILKFL